MTTTDPCGTQAGYSRHYRRGEEACQPCLDANAAYFRDRREDPAIRARDTARLAARSRAVARLAAEYPDRFKAILNEEMAVVYASGDAP